MKAGRLRGIVYDVGGFVKGLIQCFWETIFIVGDISVEYILQFLELVVAILGLVFQVIVLFRELCIEAMYTFTKLFRNIILMISSINCDVIEEFMRACIIVIFWILVVKFIMNFTWNKVRFTPGISSDSSPVPQNSWSSSAGKQYSKMILGENSRSRNKHNCDEMLDHKCAKHRKKSMTRKAKGKKSTIAYYDSDEFTDE